MRALAVQFLVCLSIANLLFVRAWELLNEHVTANHLRLSSAYHWWSTIVNVVIVGTTFFAIQLGIRNLPWKHRHLLLRFGLVAAVALLIKRLNELDGWISVRPIMRWIMSVGQPAATIGVILMLALACAVLFLIGRSQKVAKGLASLLMLVSPYFFMNVVLASHASIRDAAAFQELPRRVPDQPQKPGPRVVWIIFDSMDYHYTFEERPDWLKMPEFDRLRKESFDFADAQSPAERTEKSIPSLLTNKIVLDERIAAPNDFVLELQGGQHVRFRGMKTVFGDAEYLGARTAALGVYLPYGRLIADQTTYCRWWQWNLYFDSESAYYASILPQIMLATGKPLSTWEQLRRQIANHEAEIAEANRLFSDPNYRLVYAHFFPPHQPGTFDARKMAYSVNNYWQPDSYHNSLALADQTLGRLRKEMEKTGEWDKTLVIVSADHSWRAAWEFGYRVYTRIPFLIHFPKQAAGVKVEPEVNSLCTHDLVLDYLKGNVKQPDDLVPWVAHWMKVSPKVPLVTNTTEEKEASAGD